MHRLHHVAPQLLKHVKFKLTNAKPANWLRSISDKSNLPKDVPYASSIHRQEKMEKTDDVKLPPSVDVVVIGGGVMGCSAFYHLSKKLNGNVILLEKDKLTAGTTWHTAGFKYVFTLI